MKALDRLVLKYVLWRLERFEKIGDVADKFADRLAALLADEVKRRNVMLAGWADGLKAAERDQVIRELFQQELSRETAFLQ
jgi:hypothetical protein